MLDLFWASHDPAEGSWSRQYMAAVFYHNEEQRRLVAESLEGEATARKREIRTLTMPVGIFYLAEDYHQKHALQRDYDLMSEFRKMYPDFHDIVNSTAAARVNGILGGFGKPSLHKSELDSYGLSDKGRDHLLGYLASSG
jgi:peptide-methionine (S)-S-oxide reductase